MERDDKTLAVVLMSEKSGERDRIVSMLTPDDGLIRAKIYGAQKSAKSIKAPLFSEGVFSLYKRSGSVSLKDADLTNIRDSITEDLDSLTAASFISELAAKARYYDKDLYLLTSSSLDALSLGFDFRRCISLFIIKYLSLYGTFSDFVSCPVCQKVYSNDEILGYNNIVGSSCCQSCSTGEDGLILPPNARAFIRECIKRDFKEDLTFRLSSLQEGRIFRYLLRLSKLSLPFEIKTLSSHIWPLS